MKTYRIVDRDDGPKIEGTRVTVYAVLEYLEKKRSREWIAVALGLSSRQVQAAIDYLEEHRAEVQPEYEKIMDRIRKGNPCEVAQRLQNAHAKFQQLKARCPYEAVSDAQDHGRQ